MREAHGMLQKEVAAVLQVDIAYVSKMEHGGKPVSRNHLEKLSKLFNVPLKEMHTLWLADKILHTIENEEDREKALKIALKSII